MRYDLLKTLETVDEIWMPETRSLLIPNVFCAPGLWVVIAAIAKSNKLLMSDIDIPYGRLTSYSSAIGLSAAIGEGDDFSYERINDGRTYSPLILLADESACDSATSSISGCIRNFTSTPDVDGIGELCQVIGEVYDNVWSHGKDTGFSCAQKYNCFESGESVIEFALADRGYGFRAEMNRVGNKVGSDQEAIAWCIQEGNSTKLADDEDEFQQRVPNDLIGGSPMGVNVPTKDTEANHQGLGLYKLISLVKEYSGTLSLASGHSLMSMNSSGESHYMPISYWQGVALSCRFKISDLQKINNEVVLPEIEKIMGMLKGRR